MGVAANLVEIWDLWQESQEFVFFSKQPLLKNKEMVGESAAFFCGGGLIAKSCRTLGTPWTVAHQACLSMGFSRQEWMGCYFLLQEIFLTQGSNLRLMHWQVDSLPLSHQGSLSLV